jgi:hypothetical protein
VPCLSSVLDRLLLATFNHVGVLILELSSLSELLLQLVTYSIMLISVRK